MRLGRYLQVMESKFAHVDVEENKTPPWGTPCFRFYVDGPIFSKLYKGLSAPQIVGYPSFVVVWNRATRMAL